MATSVLEIYNMALRRIGSSTVVASLVEVTAEREACEAFYEQCRDTILRDYPWSFATRNVALATLAATVQEADGYPNDWGYKYSYPSDCLFIRNLVSPGYTSYLNNWDNVNYFNSGNQVPYEILYDGAVKAIYTNLEDAKAIYTVRMTDVTKFDPGFTSALGYLLAAEVAASLPGAAKHIDRLMYGYTQAVNAAVARSMNEGYEVEPLSAMERSRL